jgi:hypothetical protein
VGLAQRAIARWPGDLIIFVIRYSGDWARIGLWQPMSYACLFMRFAADPGTDSGKPAAAQAMAAPAQSCTGFLL